MTLFEPKPLLYLLFRLRNLFHIPLQKHLLFDHDLDRAGRMACQRHPLDIRKIILAINSAVGAESRNTPHLLNDQAECPSKCPLPRRIGKKIQLASQQSFQTPMTVKDLLALTHGIKLRKHGMRQRVRAVSTRGSAARAVTSLTAKTATEPLRIAILERTHPTAASA